MSSSLSDDEFYDYDDDGDYRFDEEEDVEGEEMEADEAALSEEDDDSAPTESPINCWAITEESLSAAQQEDLSKVMAMLSIKQHHARALLILHRWKIECINDHLDRKGRDRMLREAGIVLVENGGVAPASSTSTTAPVTCYVCFDDLPPSDVSTMECGHCFCNDCWAEHFLASLDSGKKQIRCMAEKCGAICDEAEVQRLLGGKYPDAAKRVNHFLLHSYVEDNVSAKWCPSMPSCGRAIRVDAGERYCEVACPCGVAFCFNCSAAAHSPCPCAMWDRWDAKCRGESASTEWILMNTKNCPRCLKPIEKNGGCNLVTCRCGQYLCWLCGGATGFDHTMESIAGHSCNRFKDEGKKTVDSKKRQLFRYTHYYGLFMQHGDSYRTESEKLGPAVAERAKRLESDLGRPATVRDADWLSKAHRTLLVARQVLSRSFGFAYYMFGDEVRTRPAERGSLAMAQNWFEDKQEQLQLLADLLSQVLETDLPAMAADEIMRTKHVAEKRAKIVVGLCRDMYKCVQDDLLPLLEDHASSIIAAYQPEGPSKAIDFPA